MSTRDTSGSTPQHSHPHNNTMSRNEKFWVDQVTPPPPPRNDKGWGTTRGGGVHEDDVTHLIASGHAAVQMMHKTPSLWRRAKMPWIFGNAKQIQNQHPSLCAPWSVHVDRHLKIFGTSKT